MKHHHRLSGKIFMLSVFAALAVGCAVSPHINVDYKLFGPSDIPVGQKVYIDFKDVRSDHAFLGKEAKAHFEHFNGIFHLYIDRNDKKEEFTGSYDLKGLVKKTLSFRLRNHGVEIVKTNNKDSTVMEIELKQFILDLKDGSWITSIEFAARLAYGTDSYVSENISATAERYKIWGRKEAEKTISDAISEAVNKLDIQRFFKKPVR
jgi:hypothetical protein